MTRGTILLIRALRIASTMVLRFTTTYVQHRHTTSSNSNTLFFVLFIPKQQTNRGYKIRIQILLYRTATRTMLLPSATPTLNYDSTTADDGLLRTQESPKRRPWWFRPTSWWLCLLTACFIALLLQVQWLFVELNQQNELISQLQIQVQTKQQDQIQQLTQQVQKNQSWTILQMAITLTLLTGLITTFHMTTHLRNYAQPIIQRKVLVILWMTPIYSVTSCVSLMVPSLDGYLMVMKDFYEAYVVYNFLAFLILVLGRGERLAAVQVLAQHAPQLHPPTRFLRRYYDPPPELNDAAKANAVLTECQILCLQFVLIRPLTALMHLVLSLLQNNNNENNKELTWWQYLISPSFAVTMLTNVSVFLAFRGLLKFYHACEHDLQWLQPFAKFMSIKGVVFLTFWQGLLISIVVHMQQANQDDSSSSSPITANNNNTTVVSTDDNSNDMSPQEHAAQIQNVLICLEMLLFSIAHWCVFPWEEWQPEYRENQGKIMATPGFGIRDFVSDMNGIVEQTRRRRKARRVTLEEESGTTTTDDNVPEDDLVLQEQESLDDVVEDNKIL